MKPTSITELDRAIEQTLELISDQQVRIDRLDAEGRDSSRQREFLGTFKALLAMQEAWRQGFLSCWGRMVPRSSIQATPERRRVAAIVAARC